MGDGQWALDVAWVGVVGCEGQAATGRDPIGTEGSKEVRESPGLEGMVEEGGGGWVLGGTNVCEVM